MAKIKDKDEISMIFEHNISEKTENCSKYHRENNRISAVFDERI